jgi:hypothetical protein
MKRAIAVVCLLLLTVPAHARSERFKLLQRGTVKDFSTGLEWEVKCDIRVQPRFVLMLCTA